MYYLVYKTTNLQNGKYYIGAHKTKNIDDGYLGSGNTIKYALEKYGKYNFQREILFRAKSAEIMFWIERMFVDELVVHDEYSYNLMCGGNGVRNASTVKRPKTEEHINNFKISRGSRVWVSKDNLKLIIKSDELDIYLRNGWVKGRGKTHSFNKLWISKDKINKMIFQYELLIFLQDGWRKGRHQFVPVT